MDTPLKVQVILGSTRAGRFGAEPAKWIMDILAREEGIKPELIDLAEWPLPFFDEAVSPSMSGGKYANDLGAKWAAKVAEADAYIMISPEYNHAPSAVLKNAIDWVSPEWNKKPVGFISYGSVGGARAIEILRLMAIELQMVPVRAAVNIMAPWMLRDEKGSLKDGALAPYTDAAHGLIDQIRWWGTVLRSARTAQ